jgi:hypothetical protein
MINEIGRRTNRFDLGFKVRHIGDSAKISETTIQKPQEHGTSPYTKLKAGIMEMVAKAGRDGLSVIS